MRWVWALLSVSILASCTEAQPEPDPVVVPVGCQPLLGDAECFLPYPSDFFLVPDSTLPSGHRVEIGDAAQPKTIERVSAVPRRHRGEDGFSPFGVIVATLLQPVAAGQLVAIRDDYRRSLDVGSSSLILDTVTGAFVPHFADLDPRTDDLHRQAIVLHPLVPLEWRRRYVVALQSLEGPGGASIAAAPGFVAERSQAPFEADVVRPLVEAGVDADAIQLAFTFTTASEENTHADLERVSELTKRWLEANAVTVEVTKLAEASDTGVWRRIDGRFTAPQFLAHSRADAILVRDDDGEPVLNGTTSVPFTAIVPSSVRDRFAAGRAIMHGHGFFGSRENIDRPRIAAVATETEAVLFSTDWRGFSTPDLFVFTDLLASRPGDTPDMSDRLLQANAERLVLARAIRTTMAELDAFRRPSSGPGVSTSSTGASNSGLPLFETSALYFLGTSAGGVHGTAVAALSSDIDRAVLNVTGGSLSQMMFRAQPFKGLLLFLDVSLPDPLDQQKFAVLQQPHFDRTEAISWGATAARREGLELLLQVGVGDVWVPNMSSFLLARAMALPMLEPSPIPVYGIDSATSPATGSAMTLFDFGIDPAVYDQPDLDAPSNTVHTDVLELDAALEQVDRFFAPSGMIEHTCDAICDPE